MSPGDENGPLPKSFQSNTMVPNKSTLVEDDDDDLDDDFDGRSDAFGLDVLQSRRGTTATIGDKKLLADSQAQATSLQERVDELESLMKSKDQEISRLQDEHEKSQVCFFAPSEEDKYLQKQASTSEREEWENLKADLEGKVADVENANTYLQSRIEELQENHSSKEQDLLQQLEALEALGAAHGTGGDAELQQRYEELESRHQSLQVELQEHHNTTEEVRRDAATFLKEMRAMSERSNATWEREEKLSRDVNRLEEEVKEWKSRYIKAKTQLRHLRTSSVGMSNFRPDVGNFAKENELMQPNGMVKDTHVTKFQISVDELLRTARSGEPGLVLNQMKVVVVAVRHIINDIEIIQKGEELPFSQKRAKSKVSTTANNLITASKNFASSSGLSPISLLDAAASHLSTAVIELLRQVKISASPAEDLEEEDEDNIAPMQSPGYFSVAPSQGRLSHNGSVYSAISTPSTRPRSIAHRHTMSRSGIPGVQALAIGKANYGLRPQDHELEELKVCISLH
jgi:predicted  nucleic acid-binding Zn-ribbon protein